MGCEIPGQQDAKTSLYRMQSLEYIFIHSVFGLATKFEEAPVIFDIEIQHHGHHL